MAVNTASVLSILIAAPFTRSLLRAPIPVESDIFGGHIFQDLAPQFQHILVPHPCDRAFFHRERAAPYRAPPSPIPDRRPPARPWSRWIQTAGSCRWHADSRAFFARPAARRAGSSTP